MAELSRVPAGVLFRLPCRELAAVVGAGIAIGLLPLQTTVLFVLVGISLWLGFAHPDWGLGLLALTIPMQRHFEVGVGHDAVTWTKVVVWSLIAGWVVWLFVTRNRIGVDSISASIFVVAMVLACSIWNARDLGVWMGETYRWFLTALIAVFSFDVYRRGKSPLGFLLGSLVGTIVSVGYALWQIIEGIGPPSFEARGFLRAWGPFTHPNQFAIYLELTAPLFLAVFIGSVGLPTDVSHWRIPARLGPLWLIGSLVGMAGVIMSQSRGGFVGMAAGLAIVILLSNWRVRIVLIRFAPVVLTGALIALAVLIVALGSGAYVVSSRDVLVTPANFAVQERLAHWHAAIEMAKAHPFIGIGAGNFNDNFREFTDTWRFRIGRGHAHNTYFQMLAQAGIAGLTAYLVMLSMVARMLVRSIRLVPRDTRLSLLVGAAGITVAVCAHGIFEYVHVLSLSLQLVIVWGMVAAIGVEVWKNHERYR